MLQVLNCLTGLDRARAIPLDRGDFHISPFARFHYTVMESSLVRCKTAAIRWRLAGYDDCIHPPPYPG